MSWCPDYQSLLSRLLPLLRTRLAVDAKRPGGHRQFSGILDVYVKTIKKDGWRGLYRGFGISCACIFVYRGLYFGLFDSLKPLGRFLFSSISPLCSINALKENIEKKPTFLLSKAFCQTSLVLNIFSQSFCQLFACL